MIEISYRRGAHPGIGLEKLGADPGLASRADLLWTFFPADIVLRSELGVIETRHAFIPLFHVVLSIIGIVSDLSSAESGESRYQFTESAHELVFARREDAVEIWSTFDAVILEGPMADFCNAVRVFGFGVLNDLVDEHPSLGASPLVAEVSAGLGRI